MKNYILSTILTVLLLTIGGCGSEDSSDSVTVTGTFVDDLVEGLNYSCSSGSTGVTNASGEYTCNLGDDVTFMLGNISLGTVAAQTTAVTPYTLFPSDTTAAINLARLLQSVNTSASDGTIVINDTLTAKLPSDTDFTNASFETATETALGITLVSSLVAQKTMDTEISKALNITHVILETTQGNIKIELFPNEAPLAVENFTTHIDNGYYDGIAFHRIINDFMIQGGDPTESGYGGESIWGEPFVDEFKDKVFDKAGVVAMANSGPGTNGSQFFITTASTPWLNGYHTIFGQITPESLETLEKLNTISTDSRDRPLERQEIIKAYYN